MSSDLAALPMQRPNPQSVGWEHVPETARREVEQHTGPVLEAVPVSAGLNSHLSARLRATSGWVFVKGLPADHPRVRTQHREAEINPHVRAVSPRLLWHVEAAGWNLLGFEHIDARAADLTPGSADIPRILDAVRALAEVEAADLPLRRITDRWAEHGHSVALDLLEGDTLLHTDLNPHNLLINHRAHIVDWAWPTRGAAWIDTACLALWLIASGHTPPQAEHLVSTLPAWDTTSSAAVDAFVTISTRLWNDIAHHQPQPWTSRMALAAQEWAAHRS